MARLVGNGRRGEPGRAGAWADPGGVDWWVRASEAVGLSCGSVEAARTRLSNALVDTDAGSGCARGDDVAPGVAKGDEAATEDAIGVLDGPEGDEVEGELE